MRVGRFLATLSLMKMLQPDEHLAPQSLFPHNTGNLVDKVFQNGVLFVLFFFFFFLLKLKATPNPAGVYARMFKS